MKPVDQVTELVGVLLTKREKRNYELLCKALGGKTSGVSRQLIKALLAAWYRGDTDNVSIKMPFEVVCIPRPPKHNTL